MGGVVAAQDRSDRKSFTDNDYRAFDRAWSQLAGSVGSGSLDCTSVPQVLLVRTDPVCYTGPCAPTNRGAYALRVVCYGDRDGVTCSTRVVPERRLHLPLSAALPTGAPNGTGRITLLRDDREMARSRQVPVKGDVVALCGARGGRARPRCCPCIRTRPSGAPPAAQRGGAFRARRPIDMRLADRHRDSSTSHPTFAECVHPADFGPIRHFFRRMRT